MEWRERWECTRCGRCCMDNWNFIFASIEDLDRWKKEKRKDLLAMAKPIRRGRKLLCADLWFDPKTGEQLKSCPFFSMRAGKAKCLIHDTKPRLCRDYICRQHPKD